MIAAVTLLALICLMLLIGLVAITIAYFDVRHNAESWRRQCMAMSSFRPKRGASTVTQLDDWMRRTGGQP